MAEDETERGLGEADAEFLCNKADLRGTTLQYGCLLAIGIGRTRERMTFMTLDTGIREKAPGECAVDRGTAAGRQRFVQDGAAILPDYETRRASHAGRRIEHGVADVQHAEEAGIEQSLDRG